MGTARKNCALLGFHDPGARPRPESDLVARANSDHRAYECHPIHSLGVFYPRMELAKQLAFHRGDLEPTVFRPQTEFIVSFPWTGP